MKRYNIIICEAFTLACELNIHNKFNRQLSLVIFYNNGYIKTIPFSNDFFYFLRGKLNLFTIVFKSKSILYNNLNIEAIDLPKVLLKLIDKNITEFSNNIVNNHNVKLIIDLLDLDKDHQHISQDTNDEKIISKYILDEKINKVVKAIASLDIQKLHPLLNEDMKYMKMNMYKFLNYMHKKYKLFKRAGDTFLINETVGFNKMSNNHIAEQLELNKDFEGVIVLFHGNKTKKQLSFLLRTKESKVLSISTIPSKKIKHSIKSK
tara:strand:+ start:135 stop:923 length:789 start_codon:yes stop_codon:yes gene_type:complete